MQQHALGSQGPRYAILERPRMRCPGGGTTCGVHGGCCDRLHRQAGQGPADPEQPAGCFLTGDHPRLALGGAPTEVEPANVEAPQILGAELGAGAEPGTARLRRVDVGGDPHRERFASAVVAVVVDGGFVSAHFGRHPGHLDHMQVLAYVSDAAVVAARAGRHRFRCGGRRTDSGPAALWAHLPGVDVDSPVPRSTASMVTARPCA